MDHIDRWNILKPDQVAVVLPDRTVTYRELATLVSRGSGALAGFGVKPGDRVAVSVHNDLASLVALWAVPRMGATVVAVNPRLDHRQTTVQLDLVDPALVLGSDMLTGRTTHATESLFDGRPSMPHPHAPDDLHSVFFTSGSTAEPKGVRLTWGNHEASATASATVQPVGPDDSWLAVLPLFHLGGFAITYRMFRAGGSVVLEPSYDAVRAAELMDTVSYASVVPTMLTTLLAARPTPFAGPSKAVLIGGGPVSDELVANAWDAGLPVVATYGLTETGSQVAAVPPADPGAGAVLLEGVAIEAGTAESPSAVRISGPMVSAGYWGEPDRAEWLETRDLGYLDENGHLHIIGRSDDVIISGGENIHPAEVEAALDALAMVTASAVFGVADELWGERVEAAVVLSDPTVTPEELATAAKESLADFKIPKGWHVVDELPLGPTGKVDKQALIDRAASEPGAEKT
ncbi:MAG: AMP-binding protein [Acidimicrobiia bacterium]|nr:AMP-binding protein [Acidimicrobiia bacterium]